MVCQACTEPDAGTPPEREPSSEYIENLSPMQSPLVLNTTNWSQLGELELVTQPERVKVREWPGMVIALIERPSPAVPQI